MLHRSTSRSFGAQGRGRQLHASSTAQQVRPAPPPQDAACPAVAYSFRKQEQPSAVGAHASGRHWQDNDGPGQPGELQQTVPGYVRSVQISSVVAPPTEQLHVVAPYRDSRQSLRLSPTRSMQNPPHWVVAQLASFASSASEETLRVRSAPHERASWVLAHASMSKMAPPQSRSPQQRSSCGWHRAARQAMHSSVAGVGKHWAPNSGGDTTRKHAASEGANTRREVAAGQSLTGWPRYHTHGQRQGRALLRSDASFFQSEAERATSLSVTSSPPAPSRCSKTKARASLPTSTRVRACPSGPAAYASE